MGLTRDYERKGIIMEYTYADGDRAGDGYLWRSAEYSDGSPVTPFFRAPGTVVFLLDTRNVPHLLTVHKDRDGNRTGNGSCPLAYVPNVGSLATVLSELVERIA